MRNIEVLSTGVALPETCVYSTEIDTHLGWPQGETQRLTGVSSRYYVKNAHESATSLAVQAIRNALDNCSVSLGSVDCIIAASGTMEQAIPYNAARMHAALGLKSHVVALDVNMTCLSALMALDIAATQIHAAQYKNILIVSSDVASVGLDWSNKETGGLFGDGAAAMVICKNSDAYSGVMASHFETHSEGVSACQIKGGGSLNHPSNTAGEYKPYGLFEMDGKEAYRVTTKAIDHFTDQLMSKAGCSLKEIDWVVPHQASHLAIEHLRRKLKLPTEKIVNIFKERGNQIAASIPSALHEMYQSKKPTSGQKVLIVGTSAGLSLGGMVLRI